jgi:hypothetical protein
MTLKEELRRAEETLDAIENQALALNAMVSLLRKNLESIALDVGAADQLPLPLNEDTGNALDRF